MSSKKLTKSYRWAEYSDQQLLKLRFCDLKLQLQDSTLKRRTDRLLEELLDRGFVFKPHFWLSTEWFAPDDTPGIALPFYLAHPRLMRLERRKVFEVEGNTETWCMKLLRHEAGHAIDTAYGLSRRKRYRELFGRASLPYPKIYTPKPYSRNYVIHLDLWYAQAHPVEDFAETFAVWLGRPKRWRSRYAGWPALKKLEYVDELMQEIAPLKPKKSNRKKVDSLSTLKYTLAEHYDAKCERFGLDDKAFYDQELRKLFPAENSKSGIPASSFLRKNRNLLRRTVSHWTGEFAYTVDQIIQQMIERCRELNLRAIGNEDELQRNTLAMLSVQVTSSVLSGRKGIPM